MAQVLSEITAIVGIVLFLTIFIFISIMTSWLSSIKGYNAAAWFFLGLLGGLVSLLTIGFAPNKNSHNKEIEKIRKLVEPISQHYEEQMEKKSILEIKKQYKIQTEEDDEYSRNIDSMEKLLNDEKIKKESNMMLKMYGKEAQEQYLQEKMKEFNIDS